METSNQLLILYGGEKAKHCVGWGYRDILRVMGRAVVELCPVCRSLCVYGVLCRVNTSCIQYKGRVYLMCRLQKQEIV